MNKELILFALILGLVSGLFLAFAPLSLEERMLVVFSMLGLAGALTIFDSYLEQLEREFWKV